MSYGHEVTFLMENELTFKEKLYPDNYAKPKYDFLALDEI